MPLRGPGIRPGPARGVGHGAATDFVHKEKLSMKRRISYLFAGALALVSFNLFAAKTDVAGSKGDPALFTRMPNFYLSQFEEKEFDSFEFKIADEKGSGYTRQRVEGRRLEYVYYIDTDSKAPRASTLQILRNYRDAALGQGGEVLMDRQGFPLTLRFTKGDEEIWVEVVTMGGDWKYSLNIVKKEPMRQDVVSNGTAAIFQEGLTQHGHVEVPGILFDSGKSELKPESEAALKEVATLLKGDAALKVWVVGHTDNVGTAEYNLALSKDRAASVVKMLTERMGIDKSRLASFGAGPYSPVASNKNETGRALNRRVELVAQ
jgi:OOP family OmpA-OmpF porin